MQSSVEATPNVTPLVDVMLVLLIIFMVVAPTLLDGFVAVPPDATNVRDHPKDSSDVTLGIDAHGNYFLNKQLVSASDLGARLQAIYGNGTPNHVLYLKADQSLDYSGLLTAVDTARAHGVTTIGMITRQPAKDR